MPEPARSAKKSQKTENEAATATIDAMKTFGPIGETAQKVCADVANETLRFVTFRMQQDLETQRAMLACTNLVDVQKAQADFCTQALKDYQSQASRIMEIMSAAAPKGLDFAPLLTRRDYDDVPL